MPPAYTPARGSHEFIRLVERTTNALVTKDDGALEEVKKALIQVHQQYDQVHEESEAKQARLNRLREEIRTADQQYVNKGDWSKKMDETWNALSSQFNEVKKRNQDSLQSKKVYQHMLKRTQREQAILKQKLFQMEEHLDRKKRELQQKRTESEQARCARVQIHQTLENYSEEATRERDVCKSALEAINGEFEKRKEANGRRADFESWRHEVALDAANEAFNTSAGRLRKLYAIEKLSGNFLQKTTFEQVERSQTTEDNFQKIRDVTGLADVMDIVHKFLNRDVEQEQLKKSVKEAELTLEALLHKNEKLKKEMEGLPVNSTDDPMALHKELEQEEQKLNEAIEEQEACRVRLQKITIQSEHMKRWAVACFEELAHLREFQHSPVESSSCSLRMLQYDTLPLPWHIQGQIEYCNAECLNIWHLLKEQKNLLNNHSFLKDNCRAQASDAQAAGSMGDGNEDDPATNFAEDREKRKNEAEACCNIARSKECDENSERMSRKGLLDLTLALCARQGCVRESAMEIERSIAATFWEVAGQSRLERKFSECSTAMQSSHSNAKPSVKPDDLMLV
ncbi:Uncharacterized protein SCF082_LOCUS25174 [Durusdinium trenchii]|uniref:Uncharacterized protein n=1 Tax=Durusdinium trenchii TaxID=1381693 RepID=A0ABP0M0E1_9DINO